MRRFIQKKGKELWLAMNSWLKTILLIVLAAVVTRLLPFSEYFRNVNTFVHEMAHALVTLLSSGHVVYIHLFEDHSGVTYLSLPDSWRIIPVSLAGYIGASLFAWLLFRWYARGQQQFGLAVLTVLAAIGLMLFVRNEFGMIWCAGFIALSVIALVIRWPQVRDAFYLFVSFICLVESVLTALMILLIAIQEPHSAGDATNLEGITGIPSIAWAIVFVLVAIWCGKIAISELFPHERRARSRGR